MKFRKNPIIFEAVQWTGDNVEELRAFVGTRPSGDWDIDANQPHVIQNFNPMGTYVIPSELNTEATGELWVDANGRWLPIETGEWVVKDERGFYPCKDEIIHKNNTELTPELEELLAQEAEPKTFWEELVSLLNSHSMENYSGTPDWILAEYIRMSLQAWDLGVRLRSEWRGEDLELPALQHIDRDTKTMVKLKALVEDGVIHLNPEFRNTELYSELKPHVPDQTVFAPGALDGNDGKEVPLVTYTDGRRNEIGTAKVQVTPGEVLVTGTITGALAQFEDVNAAYSLSVGKDEAAVVEPLNEPKDDIKAEPSTSGPESRFERYQKRGLSS